MQRARRSGHLQDAHATVGGGHMYGQAEERRQQAQRGDRIGWFTGGEAGLWRMLPASLETGDHFVGLVRRSGGVAAADLTGCAQRSKAMVACYPGGGSRYAAHCDNVCDAGHGES